MPAAVHNAPLPGRSALPHAAGDGFSRSGNLAPKKKSRGGRGPNSASMLDNASALSALSEHLSDSLSLMETAKLEEDLSSNSF